MSHLNSSIFTFYANFCPIDIDLSGNTAWPQTTGCQKLAKLTIFGIFDELFVNGEARFARNIEWDFFYDFQPPCAEIKDKTNHVYYGLTWTMMRHTRK